MHRQVEKHHAGQGTVAVGRPDGAPGWLARCFTAMGMLGKAAAGLLSVVLVIALLVTLCASIQTTRIRIKPFETSKQLEESGYGGAALAELFRDQLGAIDRAVKAVRAAGNRAPIADMVSNEPGTELDIKAPGTDITFDRLSDFLLTALHREINVTGISASSAGQITLAVKTARHPFRVSAVPAAAGCSFACMSSLLGRAAENLYLEQRPCDLELYYLAAGRADFEAAARSCVKRDPIFAYNVWSVCELHRGNLHTAVEKLQSALALTGGAARRADLRAMIYNNWGTILAAAGDDAAAVGMYDAAIRSKDNYARAWFNRALALERLHNTEAAAHSYDRAVDADPTLGEAYVNRGSLLFQQKKYEDAAVFLGRAHALLPANADILYNLAVALQATGKDDAALADFELITEIDPAYADAYIEAADLLATCHRVAAAAEVLRRGLGSINPQDRPRLQTALSEVLAELTRHPEAPRLQAASCQAR